MTQTLRTTVKDTKHGMHVHCLSLTFRISKEHRSTRKSNTYQYCEHQGSTRHNACTARGTCHPARMPPHPHSSGSFKLKLPYPLRCCCFLSHASWAAAQGQQQVCRTSWGHSKPWPRSYLVHRLLLHAQKRRRTREATRKQELHVRDTSTGAGRFQRVVKVASGTRATPSATLPPRLRPTSQKHRRVCAHTALPARSPPRKAPCRGPPAPMLPPWSPLRGPARQRVGRGGWKGLG